MSTATNGAAIEDAFDAMARAVDVAGSYGPAVANAAERAKVAGETWLEQSRDMTTLALDAFDSGINAYVEYTKHLAAAAKFADRAMGVAESNAKIVSELAATYSNAARDMLNKR